MSDDKIEPLGTDCDPESLIAHWERAGFFLGLANQSDTPPIPSFHFAVAAVYSCAAIADQLCVNAARVGGDQRKSEVVQQLMSSVSFYRLIDNARVHDFHRKALTPPTEGRVTVTMSGPITLTSRQGGVAALGGVGADQEIVEERNSTVIQDRPLQQRDAELFDYDTKTFVPIVTIVAEFLRTVHPVLVFHTPTPETNESSESSDDSLAPFL